MAGMPVALIDALDPPGRHRPDGGQQQRRQRRHRPGRTLAAGRVRKMVCSFPRQPDSWVFDGLYRAGKVELELVPQGNLAERMRAAGAGIGAFFSPDRSRHPARRGQGDPRDRRPHLRAGVPDPRRRRPDRAHVADRWRNLVYRKTARNFGPVMATAAATVIAQVREIVEHRRARPGGRRDARHLRRPSRWSRDRRTASTVDHSRPRRVGRAGWPRDIPPGRSSTSASASPPWSPTTWRPTRESSCTPRTACSTWAAPPSATRSTPT